MDSVVGTVASLWRYPVKSMLGERCDRLELDARGVAGDRLFAVRDEAGKLGSGKHTRRFRRMDGLFGLRARYDGGLVPVITLPDGSAVRGDAQEIHAAISTQLGIPVTLSREEAIPHHDAGPVHLVTTSSLRAIGAALGAELLDERRFRPNVVLETEGAGFLEDAWIGRTLRVGDTVRLSVESDTERCRMIGLPQDELDEEPRALRELARLHAARLGIYLKVIAPGAVRVGDRVIVERR